MRLSTDVVVCLAAFVAGVRRRSKRNVAVGEIAMSILEFLLLLLVAGICGAIAQALVGYSRGGCLVAIALGFIGALLGTWLARVLGLPAIFPIALGGRAFPIIWSIIGGALFAGLLSLFSRGGKPVQ
jgi:uncharacterized membrane protein YeaQ/YmgE (transglycosylase-associated protein family)